MPWRTTALALAGTEYLGSLQLPGGSTNHVFARGDDVVMVVWNDEPTEEVMYLGDRRAADRRLGTLDPAGRERCRQTISGRSAAHVRHRIEPAAGRAGTAAWSCERPHAQRLRRAVRELADGSRTFFPQGVGGRVRMVGPTDWKIDPRMIDFKLSAGEEAVLPFSVTLPFDAASGRQPMRIEFDIGADRHTSSRCIAISTSAATT